MSAASLLGVNMTISPDKYTSTKKIQKNTKEYDHQQRIIEAQLSAPFLLGGNMTIGPDEQNNEKSTTNKII